ncbi:MAG TPA: substrate-binding domain-containing protein [Gemmatimonadales bacterium]|nr:substrate-binding domain-containing protein [Gemmatimonadales bacterium]
MRWAARGALLLALAPGAGDATAQAREVVLATTTSVRDAGLLDSLLPPFERRARISVRVIAVGSGQAMALGRRGEADILILHDPEGEARFVAEGYGLERQPLMHNEFVLVGPPADPAGVRGRGAVEAFRAIARAGAPFVSRGDRSGTHEKERRLWALAGVEPSRAWYREAGQGMGATLLIADQLRAYTLTDVGTLLAHKAPLELAILVEGDSVFRNPYHVILVNPERFPRTRAEEARALRDYLLSAEAQRAIGEFRKGEFGRALFVPER